ncbi:MAG TPA: PIN domain-containing protein, partial [Bacillota bacterium]|nr:PIN domain-containing protein [Bacillota bacterium]
MREVFVDTSAWIAVSLEKAHYHKPARSVYFDLLESSTLVTTNFILAEVYTSLRKAIGAEQALAFLRFIHASPRIVVVRADRTVEKDAERILAKYSDHEFSYTDAVSFAVMKKRNIKEVLPLIVIVNLTTQTVVMGGASVGL